VVESKEAETNLPRRAATRFFCGTFTSPDEAGGVRCSLVRSLKPGGGWRLLIFRRGRAGSGGRIRATGRHGIPQKIVVEELSAAGLQVEKIVNDCRRMIIVFVCEEVKRRDRRSRLGRHRTAREDAGLPDTHRRDPHNGESRATQDKKAGVKEITLF